MRNFKLPKKLEINSAISMFSKRERVLFFSAVALLLFSTLAMLSGINNSFMTEVPSSGGSVSEGIVGTPRFANPVLASSPVDLDIVALIYSGLMRRNPDGSLMPDLAEKYEVSGDGLVYTFTLKDGLYFHDGAPLTTGDILFTIETIKDSVIKSPQRVNWSGVTVEVLDEKTVTFNLRQPYASFLGNATLGIMPAHIWRDSPIELSGANTEPIGSGPYMISKTSKQSSGIIESYTLSPFDEFALGSPYLRAVNLYFYTNEDDLIKMLENGTIDQTSSLGPENAKMLAERGYQIESTVLPRVFGLFFNQNVNQVFVDKVVTQTIDKAIDKNRIVRDVLLDYGVTIDGPIPPNHRNYVAGEAEPRISREKTIQEAKDILSKGGWNIGEDGFLEKVEKKGSRSETTKLEFSISTSNAPELVKTAELIQADLTAVGMKVDVKTFEVGNLNQGVIRPRKYDVLLFGQIINNESDLFAFWHSSQRKDPGLNISLYTNVKTDKILEDAFITTDEEARIEKYLEFQNEIKKDMPAVFLYSPEFIYVVSKNLKQSPVENIISPSDRYLSIHSWYTKTENVWRAFAQ